MAETRHGASNLQTQPGTTVTIDKQGLITGRAVFKCDPDSVQLLLPTTQTFPIAAYQSDLGLEKRVIKFDVGHAVITCDYAGTTYTTDTSANTTVELIIGTSEEPIETHPDFGTFAGRPSQPNPTSKPIFLDPETGQVTQDDAKGMFSGFASSGDLAGVVSYLASRNITYRKSWTQKTEPTSLGGVGSISAPPSGPNVNGQYNWLYIGMSYRQVGDAFNVSKEWKLSGPKGWESDIY